MKIDVLPTQLCVHIHHNPFVVCFRNGTKNCNFNRNFLHFFQWNIVGRLIYFFIFSIKISTPDIDSICNSLLSACENYLTFFISIAHRDVRMHTLHSAIYPLLHVMDENLLWQWFNIYYSKARNIKCTVWTMCVCGLCGDGGSHRKAQNLLKNLNAVFRDFFCLRIFC